MDVDQQITKAISEFIAWERPWEFRLSVLQSPHLEPSGRAAFDRIWSLAAENPFWRECSDLTTASEAVEASLQEAAPSLSASEVASIVRATSYDWR